MKRLWLILFVVPLLGQSKIEISNYVDEITDNNVLTLTLKSEKTQSTYYDEKHAILTIISNAGELSLKVFWGGIYLGDSPKSVTYRIGKNNPITEKWSTSNGYEVTISRKPVDVIREMVGSTKSFFRTTPYREDPITFEFDVSELKSIVEKFPNHFTELNTVQYTDRNERIGEWKYPKDIDDYAADAYLVCVIGLLVAIFVNGLVSW